MSLLVGTRRALLGKKGTAYLLDDEFHDTLAAGSVNGTLATPGPGTRETQDTAPALSIGSGVATIDGTMASWFDPTLSYSESVTRQPGRLFVASALIAANTRYAFQWSSDATPNAFSDWDDAVAFVAGDIHILGAGTVPDIILGTVSAATTYEVALVMAYPAGAYAFIKGGAYTARTLLYRIPTGGTSVLYALVASYTNSQDVDFIRVPAALWLPTPLACDSFTRANGAIGTSEASGPDAQVCPARTWTGATWTVASNEAINTPTQGATLWDGPASVFTAGTYAWVAYGTNTIANVANRLQVTYADNASGAYVTLRDSADLSSDLVVGGWYLFTCDADMDAGDSARLAFWGGAAYFARSPGITDAGLSVIATVRMASATGGIVHWELLAGGEVGYLDNLSLQAIALSTLFASLESSTANVVAQVECDVVTAGTQAGMVLSLDDATTPANFVIAYHDGTSAKLDKCVAGTYTSVISAVATYAAGATMVVVKDGTAYSLFYNNAKVGATSTISDAGIVDNTLHGLFSTYSGNQLDNFLVMPRGGGAYADLDQWSGVNP